MDALIYRYKSIYEPSVINSFKNLGINCIEEYHDYSCSGSNYRIELVSKHIISHIQNGNPLVFVFSINFFPDISEICERLNTLYICWSVDCPVIELFSNSIKNKHNRIFLFDYNQFLRFSPHNPDCIFYLPLSTDTNRWDSVISSISVSDKKKYTSDISFVGSLYNEKNPMNSITLSDFNQGYIDGLLEAQRIVYGSFFIEKAIPNSLVNEIVPKEPVDFLSGFVEPIKKYIAANEYLGSQLTVNDRLYVLNMLSKSFNVSLYTQSDYSNLPNICYKGSANTFTEMPKIFNLSKINLNLTMRPISSGIPLRVFDVLGCKGFLITNYQDELYEHFEVGKDLEVFSSTDELLDKCNFYLTHDDLRESIAINGYNKIKQLHTTEIRISQLLSFITK